MPSLTSLKRVHPSQPNFAFTAEEFSQWAATVHGDADYGLRLYDESISADQASITTKKQIHPMDADGKEYSWMEFYTFADFSVEGDERIWKESIEVIDGVQGWGN